MAVSSVSSSSSSSIYGSRSSNIISGLASGLDTESMIEGMVSGIKSKIDTQKQNQQILLWQQEAYRSISDQLVQISTKYTSYTSSTNLMSSAFFQPSIITSLGENASKISASGSTNSDIQIQSVDKMAQTETISFTGLNNAPKGMGSDRITGNSAIGLTDDDKVDVSKIAGQQLSFEYGNKSFTITFDSNRKYESLADVVDEINKQLGNATISTTDGTSVTMSSKLKAEETDDGKLAFKFVEDGETNTLELKSYSSTTALDALHLTAGATLTKGGSLESSEKVDDADLFEQKSTTEVLADATMNVTYNGTTATIKMPSKEEFAEMPSEQRADKLTEYLQTQFDQAFGYGRIDVSNAYTNADGTPSNDKFQLQIDVVSNAGAGELNTNTFSIDSGTLNVIGEGGILGIKRGASNRIDTSKTLGDLYGLEDDATEIPGMSPVLDAQGKPLTDENGNNKYALVINGVTIGDDYTVDTTLETIMNDINSKTEAGVKVSYSKTANQFVFTSTHGGAGGKIEINSTKQTATDTEGNLAAMLFGSVSYSKDDGSVTVGRENEKITLKADGAVDVQVKNEQGNFVTVTDATPSINIIRGQDAEMTAVINGVTTKLTSGTNTFNIDGFTVTANGTFEPGENVTFDKKVDADKIVEAVKSFVEDYNKVLAEINEQYTTQPDHDNEYLPLTDDQKADMTEKQIEEYEAKAKQGLLFGDSDLGGLSNGLRFVFSNSNLSAIGINVSTSYSDKGKITLDETALRSALASDPDAVASAFTDPLETKTVVKDGKTTVETDTSSGGAMSRLKVQLDKYAATTGATKGILIEKAGSQYSPLALLQNTMQDKIDSYDDVIDKLTDQLNDKIDYYTSKFSKLETLIAQMNSQSSYLSSLGGSSY